MKTKLLLSLLSLMLSYPQFAQNKTYLPIFGNETSVCRHVGDVPTDGSLCHEVYVNKYKKDPSNNLLYLDQNTAFDPRLEVSEDNSKLWDYWNGKRFLIMDLNLNIGDTFPFLRSGETMTVTKVYEEKGRKIIEFDKILMHGWSNTIEGKEVHVETPFKFIEGVGPNYFDGIPFLILRDGVPDYIIPEMYDIFFDSCCAGELGAISKNAMNSSFSVNPSTSKSMVSIQISTSILVDSPKLDIYNSVGKLIDSIAIKESVSSMNVSSWTNGTYYFQLTSPSYHNTVVFIKK